MSRVAVLGAGAGGLSATVELIMAGHDVVLWNRNPGTIAPYMEGGAIPYSGVFGEGTIHPASISTDLATAVTGADVAVACLPSVAHAMLFDDLAQLGLTTPLVLNPGHTGAALHARQVWGRHRAVLPPLAELSTLTYVARVVGEGTVRITGRAGTVRAGGLPGAGEALDWAKALFPGTSPVADVLASSLSNVNLVLHPPGAMLGLAWVEATNGNFTFYVDGMTPGVVRVLRALDDERRTVARRFGHELPPLVEEMAAIGTIDRSAGEQDDVGAAIRKGEANSTITAPSSTEHRYYREDLPFGILPLVTLAELADQPVPTASALLTLGRFAIGRAAMDAGLGPERLGLTGLTRDDLLGIVGHRACPPLDGIPR